MKKITRIFALIMCLAMVLSLCACAPSPTAVIVNGSKVDSSELAFYLEYNRINLENKYGYISDGIYDAEITETAKKDALAQIVSAELVRQKCREYKLKLPKETREALAEDKKYLVEGQGGKAKYLEFLKENAMTDRMYDKFQENSKYYDLLFEHMVGEKGKFSYTAEQYRKFFGEHYARVQYIRFSTAGADGGEMSEGDRAEQMKKASATLALARSESSNFTQLVIDHNDDSFMGETPEGVVMSTLETANLAQFKDLFNMKNDELGGVFVGADGFYIVKRIALDAGYFDENSEAIERAAKEWQFNELMSGWEKEAVVKTTEQFKAINLQNLKTYVK